MEKEIIYSLINNFESFTNTSEEGIEFWLARDLQNLLGYDNWRNFRNVISKAQNACEVSGQQVSDHFADVGKTIIMPKNAEKTVEDLMLSRYACYLIAQNGDPRKQEIAFAQTYFAVQTRKAEVIEQRIYEVERVQARHKLAGTEKELSKVIYEQTGSDKNFALIRSKGDKALFNRTTQEMKDQWGIANKPLADHMPTILLKAKDFATEITIFNAKQNQMKTEDAISTEHVTNNTAVRSTLLSRGIVPENLPPEDDVKKVERKLASEIKKSNLSAKNLKGKKE